MSYSPFFVFDQHNKSFVTSIHEAIRPPRCAHSHPHDLRGNFGDLVKVTMLQTMFKLPHQQEKAKSPISPIAGSKACEPSSPTSHNANTRLTLCTGSEDQKSCSDSIVVRLSIFMFVFKPTLTSELQRSEKWIVTEKLPFAQRIIFVLGRPQHFNSLN